jgi:hypothetical protein
LVGLASITACGGSNAAAPIVEGPHGQEVALLIEAVDRDNLVLVSAKLAGVEYIVEKADKTVTKRVSIASDVPASKSKYCALANVKGMKSAETSHVIVLTRWQCECCDISGPDRLFEFADGRLSAIRVFDVGRL